MTSLKIARHAKILELIEKYDIETQDELAQKLCEEGFMVTPVSYTHLDQSFGSRVTAGSHVTGICDGCHIIRKLTDFRKTGGSGG